MWWKSKPSSSLYFSFNNSHKDTSASNRQKNISIPAWVWNTLFLRKKQALKSVSSHFFNATWPEKECIQNSNKKYWLLDSYVLFGMTALDISEVPQTFLTSRLVKICRIILKYHSCYICQIPIPVMLFSYHY